MSFALAPGRSRNGPMRCPPNSPRSTSPDAPPMPGLVDQVKARAPKLRGRLAADAPVAETTWFRVGGPAQALFSPADEDDLAYVLAALPRDTPVTTGGLGSDLIGRDRGGAGRGRHHARLPRLRRGGRAGSIRRQGRGEGRRGRPRLPARRARVDRR